MELGPVIKLNKGNTTTSKIWSHLLKILVTLLKKTSHTLNKYFTDLTKTLK